MTTSIILTVLGQDRPGIVETLSQLLAEKKGNWTDSSMLNLDGKFAGILRATLPSGQAEEFIAELSALKNQGLSIVAECSEEGVATAARYYQLELIGQDRPAILHQLTSALVRQNISVEELTTEVQSASMSGEDLFIAKANVLVPPDAHIQVLQSELEELADELMVDIDLKN